MRRASGSVLSPLTMQSRRLLYFLCAAVATPALPTLCSITGAPALHHIDLDKRCKLTFLFPVQVRGIVTETDTPAITIVAIGPFPCDSATFPPLDYSATAAPPPHRRHPAGSHSPPQPPRARQLSTRAADVNGGNTAGAKLECPKSPPKQPLSTPNPNRPPKN